MLESIVGDIRFALRGFARRPLTTATIVLVLSIGIGVHAAAFSLIQALTMRPPAGVPGDDALVAIRGMQRSEDFPRWRARALSVPELEGIAARRDVFSSVARSNTHDVVLDAGGGDGRWAQAQFVTGGYFATVSLQPILGPGLPWDGDQAAGDPEPVVVLGHTLWRTTFASSPDVVGRIIHLNGVAVRIAGVAPARFGGTRPADGTSTLWLPLSARAAIMQSTPHALANRDSALLHLVARLRPGVTIAAADAAVRVIDARSPAAAPPARGITHAADVVALRGNLSVSPTNETALTIAAFEALALLILLITCTNVGALVVGTAMARRHEIAVRLSLGASRGRLVRQLLTESSLLALAGGALGLVAYAWLAGLLAVRLPMEAIGPDLGTAAFTLLVALGTGLLVGLSPALHATRRGTADALKDSAANATARSRLQRGLVVAQIALTQPLLVGLGVTMAIVLQDARRQQHAEVARQTIRVGFDLFGTLWLRAGEEQALLRSAAFRAKVAGVEAAMERVAALPGVTGVARASQDYEEMDLAVVAEDRSTLPRAAAPLAVRAERASPGFFALLDIPIVRGRALSAADTAAAEVPLVIGSDLSRDLWGSADATGRRFERASGREPTRQRYVVVGVYDSRRDIAGGSVARVYAPMPDSPDRNYFVRATSPAGPLMAPVQSVLRADVPHIPVSLETLAQIDEAERAEARRTSGAAGGGGLLALLLASVGLYAVVALALGQRRREIGVRMALGARPSQVARMLFASGLRLSIAGLLLGLPLSVIAMRVAAAEMELPQINVWLVGGAIALAVIALASVASWLPARRAAAVDPMIALRTD